MTKTDNQLTILCSYTTYKQNTPIDIQQGYFPLYVI